MELEPIDYLRLFDFVTASIALVWLMLDLRIRSKYIPPSGVYIRISLAALLLGVAAESIENILKGEPVGTFAILSTAASVWMLLGLYLGRNDTKEYQARVKNSA